MKTLYKFKYIILGAALMFGATSCEEFLEEENLSSVSDQTYLVNEDAFEELVNGAYATLRSYSKSHDLDFYGVDIYSRKGKIEGDKPLNDYTNITSYLGASESNWKRSYTAISKCNTVITRAEEIGELSESTKNLRLAEVKVIRALNYFYLVQQFGGVPLQLEEVRGVVTDFTRNTEAEVYAQIIKDLDEAIPALPTSVSQYGRVSKGAAQHLLAKVYLTLGYTSSGTAADFTTAAQLAETVISSGEYNLLNSFAEVFDIDNQENDEIIWSAQFSTDNLFNGDGNDQYQLFKFSYESYPGMNRTSDYGRGNKPWQPTAFFFNLFVDGDSREAVTLDRTIYAVEDADGILTGDTVVHFPKVAWTQEQKDAVSYIVYNDDEYRVNTDFGSSQYPMFKKFADPLAPYGDNGGTRDANIFRLAETYLIAAEAQLQAGNSGAALAHVNTIRNRAADGVDLSLTSVTIDDILNERALELAGETSRWIDLKRTGTLSDRVLAHNPHVQLHHTSAIDAHYLLRPIPENEILLTNGTLEQNPGY
ncbi:RagB/SusD family nutrient uptake outer membrane protein [uncultured Draconibacterium sp.]|uniref:RagB/SusD family nutrient uptake outer membrane protein n=1 Tax=uncultured Draconibacterium sp. TaxID=1573823 RepID=UPI0029BFD26A|nr:RagB/SusD family nutrient uptake outer membrane protein [uncultured Draconibacterium sp.]